MAKRKSIQQQQIEKLTKDNLNKLGQDIITDSAKNSKVASGDLRDSQNFRVRPYDTLTVTQNFYGKYNTPKGKKTPKERDNIKDTPLRNAVEKHAPEAVKIYIQEMTDLLKSPIITNK